MYKRVLAQAVSALSSETAAAAKSRGELRISNHPAFIEELVATAERDGDVDCRADAKESPEHIFKAAQGFTFKEKRAALLF